MSTSPSSTASFRADGRAVVRHEDLRRLALVVTGVLVVDLEDGLLAGLVLAQLVGTGADDLVVGKLLVGREGVLVDDRAGTRVGEHELERGVRLVQVEDHRLVVRRLDGVGHGLQDAVLVGLADAAQQVDRGAVRVRDVDRALEAVLDVGGGQGVAVRELQVRLELAGEGLRVVVLARLGRVTLGRVLAGGDREQRLVHVVLERRRTLVVGPGRVEGGHGVGRADRDGVTLDVRRPCAVAVAAVVVAVRPAGRQREEQDRCSPGGEHLFVFPTLIRMLLPSRLHLWSGVTTQTLVREHPDVSKGRSRHDYRSGPICGPTTAQKTFVTRDFRPATSRSRSDATSTRAGVRGTSTWLGTTTTRHPAASADAAPVGESSIATVAAGVDPEQVGRHQVGVRMRLARRDRLPRHDRVEAAPRAAPSRPRRRSGRTTS